MKYNAVDFKIRCDEALMQTCRELLADAAGEAGFESFEDTEEGLKGYVQADLFHAVQLDEAIQSFPIEGVDISYEVSEVEDQDWNETWEEQGFDPIIIDERCIIYDARQQGDTPLCAHLAPLRIGIEARMAFGTGTHETTGMCVRLVEKYVKPGDRVIDIGTGTGILAIAAAHMGAKPVLATDLDAVAVRVAAENVRINGFEGVIDVRCGDLLDVVQESGDVVIANIIADVIIMLARPVRERIADGGIFICSGISAERRGDVLRALDEADYELLDVLDQGEWCAMAARKR